MTSVVRALESSGVEYVIVGGIAAMRYGRARLTYDVDVIVLLGEGDLERLLSSLKAKGFLVERRELERAFREGTHVTIFHGDYPLLHMDLREAKTELDVEVLNGRRREHLYCCEAWLESPEDLVVAKLVYGSQADLEDAGAVLLSKFAEMDVEKLRKKAEKFGVREKLEALCEKLDIILGH